MKTTFEKEEMKLFIFWQNKQEKMKKYNLLEKQIYKLRKKEDFDLIFYIENEKKTPKIKEFDEKMTNIYAIQ